jgi:hypothetical protein
MTIETQRPELEALINERMKTGAFQNVEDVLMQALKASPTLDEKDAGRSKREIVRNGRRTGRSDAASPFKEIRFVCPASVRTKIFRQRSSGNLNVAWRILSLSLAIVVTSPCAYPAASLTTIHTSTERRGQLSP